MTKRLGLGPRETIWDIPGAQEHLEQLWVLAKSTKMIAAEMSQRWRVNVTKNAIAGRAHRTNLPVRPLPASLAGCQKPKRIGGLEARQQAEARSLAATPPKPPVSRRKPIIALPDVHYGIVRACCFPIGMPREAGFRYCEGPSLAGKSYCGEHQALCYVRPASRHEGMTA